MAAVHTNKQPPPVDASPQVSVGERRWFVLKDLWMRRRQRCPKTPFPATVGSSYLLFSPKGNFGFVATLLLARNGGTQGTGRGTRVCTDSVEDAAVVGDSSGPGRNGTLATLYRGVQAWRAVPVASSDDAGWGNRGCAKHEVRGGDRLPAPSRTRFTGCWISRAVCASRHTNAAAGDIAPPSSPHHSRASGWQVRQPQIVRVHTSFHSAFPQEAPCVSLAFALWQSNSCSRMQSTLLCTCLFMEIFCCSVHAVWHAASLVRLLLLLSPSLTIFSLFFGR